MFALYISCVPIFLDLFLCTATSHGSLVSSLLADRHVIMQSHRGRFPEFEGIEPSLSPKRVFAKNTIHPKWPQITGANGKATPI